MVGTPRQRLEACGLLSHPLSDLNHTSIMVLLYMERGFDTCSHIPCKVRILHVVYERFSQNYTSLFLILILVNVVAHSGQRISSFSQLEHMINHFTAHVSVAIPSVRLSPRR